MNHEKPIKRSNALKPLSREHHHGLLLCWKIRKGFSKGIAPERIKAYCDWFFRAYLLPHFELEEKQVFPILGNHHELILQALKEHQSLRACMREDADIRASLERIATELEQHIRFEERLLFNRIEAAATPAQLQLIQQVHTEQKFIENGSDVFWM